MAKIDYVCGCELSDGTIEIGYITKKSEVIIEGMRLIIPRACKLVMIPCDEIKPIKKKKKK